MNPGKLRHVIKVQRKTDTVDTSGEQLNAWVDFAIGMRAQIEPLSGHEFFESAKQNGTVQTRITTRYHKGILPHMQIVWVMDDVTRYFDITDVQNLNGVKRYLVIMANELLDGR